MPTTFFLFNSTQVELFFSNFEKPTVLLASFNDGAVVAPPTTIMDEAQDERLAPIKQRKVMGVTLAPWRSPLSQVILVGFVCFLCPGMFNALGGIGGGGQLDTSIQSNANTALYTTFAVFGFVAGTFLNYFGAKPTLAFGGVGYAIYAASFLCYNHTENRPFVIFAGALLGLCAALLWCAQGTVMMSYPIESEKGRYIGMFWGIFNTGAVIGSIIPIAANWNDPDALHVNDGTYIGFLVLMLAGAVLAFFLVPPDRVIRKDGTRVQRIHHPSALSEIKGLWATLKSDSYILLLFPFFWASNWFYTYQQNSYNVYMFNLRGRTFTNLWYWLAQIIGALMFGFFLDNKRMSRRTRAIAGWVILFAVVNATWGGGLKPLIGSTREKVANGQNPDLDVFDTDYTWYLILYLFYGFLDAVWQTYAYWLMGALSNEPRKLAYFAGFYKGIQSAGAAVVWSLDANKHSYYVLFGTSWGLCVVGMLFAIPVIWWRVHDTEITEMDYVRPDEKNMRVSEGEGEEARTA